MRQLVAAVLAAALCASSSRTQTTDSAVAQLAEIARREVTTKAQAEQSRADARAWLDAEPEAPLLLRAIAGWFAGGEDRRTAEQAVAEYVGEHEALPVTGFDDVVGRILLSRGMGLSEAGEWDAMGALLPLLRRYDREGREVWWLIGRRARDSGSDAGRAFLQTVVIPGLLADAGMDDAARVSVLRRLYEVEYAGPRPFAKVCGIATDGRRVSSDDALGKVLLVDYWATWCRPCMEQLPGVVEAYRRFHDRGFEVLGISLDDADHRDRVLRALADHGMTWPQIHDGFGGDSPLAQLNAVHAIPATFLLDRRGRARYWNLEGEALAAKIAELLQEK